MASKNKASNDLDQLNFGIRNEAVNAWNLLCEGLNETQQYPCKDNSYYYTDFDGRGKEWGDDEDEDYWLRKPLTEDDYEELCAGCPLLKLCYDFAVANDEKHGVWGGIWFGPTNETNDDGKLF